MINVKLEKFEGPLSLLLKMIEAEELDITQVSLAKIADQYVEYLKGCQDIDPDLLADFLVVAAKLLYIKSRALLPYLFPAEEEDLGDLERQLKMYREFLDAMAKLMEILQKKHFSFSPTGRNLRKMIGLEDKFFSPPKKLSKENLAEIFSFFLKNKKVIHLEERVLEQKINIEDKILHIQQALFSCLKVSFKEFLTTAQSKNEVIVSFLAMLELMKQKFIDVHQEELFAEIMMSKKENI
ncbi:MAG: segregation/condensation protein A [Patescibacteria group bacterium]|jgi:segregation and condensation protein A